MKINFAQMEEQVMKAFRGGEGELHLKSCADGNNKIMRATLPAGSSVGLHAHQGNSEIIYILSGTGKVLFDGEYETLSPGDCHYCPMGHSHSLINDSDGELTFFAVVPQHPAG